ncbi:MAG: ROK family protein [Ferruginibacter sp.]
MINKNKLILGIDIGGSHITAGLVDMENRVAIAASMLRRQVNRHGSAEEILSIWSDTIKSIQVKYGYSFSQVGIAMPGPFNYESGVCLIKGFDKYESLYEMNIKEELAKRIGLLPGNILFRNDAEAFLEGEIFCHAADGFENVIGVILGTGLGTAISQNGIVRDAELSVMEYEGDKIEELVSTRGLIKIYKNLTGKSVNDAQAIARLYNTDVHAKETFRLFASHLAWFLLRFIEQQSPDVLIIGGNISKSANLFMPEVFLILSASLKDLPKIVEARLGEDALLIGGACLFKQITNSKSNSIFQ